MNEIRDAIMAAISPERLADDNVAGLSAADVAAAVGIDRNTAKRHLNQLRDTGLAHVAEWRRSPRGPFTALYRAGSGEDKRQPRPYTANQRARRYIAKHKTVIKLRKAKAAGTLTPFSQLMR